MNTLKIFANTNSFASFERPTHLDDREDAARETLLNEGAPSDNAPRTQSLSIVPGMVPGMVLDGRYSIVREIGAGGIGAIYLAHDQKLHAAPVVVKVLQDRFQQSEHRAWLEKKFRGEIKALARINHHGVVHAQDAGQLPDGRLYLVMEYVSGVALRDVIPPEGMEPERAGRLIHQIAQALGAAHEQGIIHRDLKPENIMLQIEDGQEHVKLIDFGIATVRETMAKRTAAETRVAGTIRYMSPEQLKGRPVKASDIYALGVITYELLTGRQPYDTDSAVQLYERQKSNDSIEPCALRAGLPAAVQAVIFKALSFQASDRHGNAREFSEAFNRALAGPHQPDPFQTAPIPPALPRRTVELRRRGLPPIAIVLAILAVTALGIIPWRYFSQARNNASAPASPAAGGRILSYQPLLKRKALGSRPFVPTGDLNVEQGDSLCLNVSSLEDGFLYAINQTPGRKYILWFPDPAFNAGSAEVKAGASMQIPPPNEGWIEFDDEKGLEKIWLVWSKHKVPELEEARQWVNARDQGVIKNPKQIESLTRFLTSPKPAEETDNLNKQTRLKTDGDQMIGLVLINHR